MILPKEQLKLEELALANSMKQTGAPGRWKNSKMVNGVDKNNHLSLCANAVLMLCLTISNWRTRMTQDASGTEEEGDSFLLFVWFAGSLYKPSPFLHTLTSSMLEERGHGRRQMLQQAAENYEHKTETPPGKVGFS